MLLSVIAERQVHKIRIEYYRSLLYQVSSVSLRDLSLELDITLSFLLLGYSGYRLV